MQPEFMSVPQHLHLSSSTEVFAHSTPTHSKRQTGSRLGDFPVFRKSVLYLSNPVKPDLPVGVNLVVYSQKHTIINLFAPYLSAQGSKYFLCAHALVYATLKTI